MGTSVNPLVNLRGNQVATLTTRVGNMKGNQIKNGAPGTDPTDFVTLQQLNDSINSSIANEPQTIIQTSNTLQVAYSSSRI